MKLNTLHILLLVSFVFHFHEIVYASDSLLLNLQAGDVKDVHLSKVKEENKVGVMKEGILSYKKMYPASDREYIEYYDIGLELVPAAAQKLEEITAKNVNKKLTVTLGTKTLVKGAIIKQKISGGRITVDSPSKHDFVTYGPEEAAENKLAAEKELGEIKTLLKE